MTATTIKEWRELNRPQEFDAVYTDKGMQLPRLKGVTPPPDEEYVKEFNKRLEELPEVTNLDSYFRLPLLLKCLSSLWFGASMELALKVSGIPYEAYIHFLNIGKAQKGLHRNFMFLIEKNISEFELNNLKQLGLMSTTDTKAAMFLLERTRERYTPKSFVTTTALDSGWFIDIAELVQSGSISVDEVIARVGELEPMQITLLYGMEAERNTIIQKSEEKRVKTLAHKN